MTTKKVNKFLYGWKLYVDYGDGWGEYEVFEGTYTGYMENKRAYANNCSYPQKWTKGRVPNPKYQD